MSTAENKLALVQLVVESEDKGFISKVLEYARSLKKEKAIDWADELPAHVLEDILLGIEELDNGDPGVPHSVMLEEARKEFPDLNL